MDYICPICHCKWNQKTDYGSYSCYEFKCETHQYVLITDSLEKVIQENIRFGIYFIMYLYDDQKIRLDRGNEIISTNYYGSFEDHNKIITAEQADNFLILI